MTNKKLVFSLLIFVLGLSSACKTNWVVLHDKTENKVIILDTINVKQDDAQILEIIKPYKAKIDSEMSEIIAYSETNLYKDEPEGLLNNFVADLIFQKGNEYLRKEYNISASICLLNSGGLRSGLPKGAITIENVYELMPFENVLVAIQISGKDVKAMMNRIAKKGGMPESGFVMGIKSDTAQNIMIGNSAFDVSKNYTIITSDYLIAGGDDMTCFANAIATYTLSIKVRDAIIEYLREQTKKNLTINSKLDKRIYYEK
jgi:2',3'-cyclic-nucleotide 2'-phosphodiesterase (5'-nucleotidase family)